MSKIERFNLFQNEPYFKFESKDDPDFIYTAWPGVDTWGFPEGDTIIVCWVEDDLSHGINYTSKEVLQYIKNGRWIIVK